MVRHAFGGGGGAPAMVSHRFFRRGLVVSMLEHARTSAGDEKRMLDHSLGGKPRRFGLVNHPSRKTRAPFSMVKHRCQVRGPIFDGGPSHAWSPRDARRGA